LKAKASLGDSGEISRRFAKFWLEVSKIDK
jgi:hypothetical protein